MIFAQLLMLAASATAKVIPSSRADQSCTNPVTRTEWRSLTAVEQQNYIDAALCLTTKPSRLGLNTTLYDDFAYIHHKYNKIIHNVAAFLPWHRYFTHVYEGALQECGYTGSATYWDWTLDVGHLAESSVLSATSGFGGNGDPSRTQTLENGQILNCVNSGPFSNLQPAYLGLSPTTYTLEKHCLNRQLVRSNTEESEISAEYYNATYIDIVQNSPGFDTYHGLLESGPHGIIHSSIGGEMNPTTSPNEPVFFLHHAQIDRLWWLWQQVDPITRNSDFVGIKATIGSTTTSAASLDDIMEMGGLAEDLTVRDLMDTSNARLCYKY